MSKKKNRLGSSEEIISNIGNRMSNQKSGKDDKEVDDKEVDDKEVDDKEVDDKEVDDKEVDDEEVDDKEVDDENSKKSSSFNNSWFDEQEPYRSSFIIKPDMEEDFDSCKKMFRRNLRMNLSKQNAIELGWLLLKNLDKNYFNKVKKNSSPDDDLIKALKEIIENPS